MCFVLNAISFLAVLVALLLIRTDGLYSVARAPFVSVAAGTREGMRYAWSATEVRAVLIVIVLMGLVGFNFNTLVPLLASDTLHVGARAFGLLSAAFGAGALVGALVSASLRGASWNTFVGGAAGFSVLLLLLAPVHDARLAGVLLVGIGASFSLFGANANALVQLAAPDGLRGRLIAIYLFAFVGLAPLGALLAGWLVTLGGTELAFAVAGITGLVSLAIATRVRGTFEAASA
jgi:MFS family permease